MLSQKLERRTRVFHCLRFVDLLIKLDGSLPVVASVAELDAGLDTPEQIGNDGDKPVRRIPVGNVTEVLIDTKDLLEHDDAWSITARRQGNVGVKLPTIKRFDFHHAQIIHGLSAS